MATPPPARYCACGTRLARDNAAPQCHACQRKRQAAAVVQPPAVPAAFWDDERMREALDTWHMGKVLYAYRTHSHHGRVLSQEVVADWLGLTQAQLSRIENGAAPQDLGKLMQWAHSLRIPADLLWFKLKLPVTKHQAPKHSAAAKPEPTQGGVQGGLLLPVVINGHSVMVPVDARTLKESGLGGLLDQPDSTKEHEAMSPLNRRAVLKGGIAAAALPGLGLEEIQHIAAALDDARRYMDGPVVEYLRRQIAACKQDDGSLGPKKTLPVMLGLLGAIAEHARDVQPAVRRELLAIGADGAEFAGWLYRDIHQPLQAGRWYDRAMEWAQEANDPAMQGYVLLKKAQMAYDERDAVRVLTLAEAAGQPHWQLPLKVRAEVAQQQARGFAMLGEPMDTVERALSEAGQLLTQHEDIADDQGSHLSPHYNRANLTLQRASCYIEAGKPARAADLYGTVLEGDALSRRDQGYFLARRACSLALAGQPDDAASVGLAAVELSDATNSLRTKRELTRAMATLQPWATRPGPRELREALRA
ncbi:helix-turn-helix transcriptional regulator [Streptomyces sp. W16]|uniref:helix-turn-helix domain-containing protein n=1 Tax=Streptomyces sp. W16 TaxID=3076631 RepID=UPI00295A9823|nr:helix-turn-helix transcriptional regulator [Streptomyces sp. W16]MDV9168912.1 helix-turn-helix transcriptional regulator [Streptomyces sp. W16]